MPFIPFRVTDRGQFSRDQLNIFLGKHTGIVMIKEYSNWIDHINPHYHGYIDKDISSMTLRNWFKNDLGTYKKEYFAITHPKKFQDTEGYFRYICKGTPEKPPLEEFYGVEENWIVENWKRFRDIEKERQQEKTTKGITKKTELMEFMNEHYVNQFQHTENQYTRTKLLIRGIIQFHINRDEPISNNQIENYYHYIRHKIEPAYVEIRTGLITDKILGIPHRF